MNIAFLPTDRRKLRIQNNEDNSYLENDDFLWIATIIRNVPPDRGKYLYLAHPASTFSIIHKLEGNWKKDIQKQIKSAFIRSFENLKEIGLDIGSYLESLNTINYVSIPQKYLLTVKNFKRSTNNFRDLFFTLDFPSRLFVPELQMENFNHYANTSERPNRIQTPLKRLEKILKNYPLLEESTEIDFSENEKALKRPEMEYITNFSPRELKNIEDKNTLVFDKTNLFIKEPEQQNLRKINRLSKKIEKLSRTLIDKDPSPDSPQVKRIEKLMNQINQYIDYMPAPYSGEYKTIEIPEKLPDHPVLEFLITLDNSFFPVQRRIAVSGDMEFVDFDKLISHLYRWAGFPYHLSEFIFPPLNEPEGKEASEVLVWQEKDLPEPVYRRPADITYLKNYNPFSNAVQTDIKNRKLKEYFPKFKTAQYRYDFGDNWFHAIELVGIYNEEDYGKELPYLIETTGVAPLDDMGGVEGFNRLFSFDYDFFEDEQFLRFSYEWNDEQKDILRAPGSLAPLFKNK